MESQTISGDHNQVHVFMVSFPGQGHINPLLRLGKIIASKGLLVTFTTTEKFGQGIRNSNDVVLDQPVPVGDGFIRFEFFDDEWPDNDPRKHDLEQYIPQLESVGRRWVPERLVALAREGRPVSCLVNNQFIPWVTDVAEELGLCSATLWPLSCACFLAFFCFNNNLFPFPTENTPHIDVEIPTLPLLKWYEIPTFLHPTTPGAFLTRVILEQFNNLSKVFCVLVDTFYELEKTTVDYIQLLAPIPIRPVGPLFMKSLPGGSVIRADSFRPDQDCLKWLDGKPVGSVVYITFGTVVLLKQEQVDEFAAGIEAAGVPFLWEMKQTLKESGLISPYTLPDGFLERVGDNGMVCYIC